MGFERDGLGCSLHRLAEFRRACRATFLRENFRLQIMEERILRMSSQLRVYGCKRLIGVRLLELSESLGDRCRGLPRVKPVGCLEISLPPFKLPQLNEQDSVCYVELGVVREFLYL